MKHVLQGTNKNFDLSNQNQNSKSGDSRDVLQLPSPFPNGKQDSSAYSGALPPQVVDL